MKKINIRTIVGYLVLAIILVLIGRKVIEKKQAATTKTNKKGGLTSITADVIVVKAAPLRNDLNLPGLLLAAEEVNLNTEAAGRVIGLFFDDGQLLKKGDLLLKIDDESLRAQLNKAKSLLQEAQTLEQRQRQLLTKEAISNEEFEQAITSVAILKADVELLQSQINKTELRAPFSGVASFRQLSIGSFVQIGTAVTKLVDNSSIRVEYAVPEKYAARIKIGSSAQFITETSVDTFVAKVYAFEPIINQQTRSVLVRARMHNPTKVLVPGAYAKVLFELEAYNEAVSIPTEAVIPEMEGKKVYVVRNGLIQSQKVATGIRLANKVQITQGLKEGDTVLVSGILQAKPGMEIIPIVKQ